MIYMQENHSYDNYFGMLPRGDGFTLDGQGKPTNSNPNANGDPVTVFHQESTCNVITGDHGWNGTHRSWNGGAMDGFAKASGDHVMGYYDDSNLPFYWDLAQTFPICDHAGSRRCSGPRTRTGGSCRPAPRRAWSPPT
ncbi:MAG: alkaline phosphatase family protein [Acidimicrobiales bacterium]